MMFVCVRARARARVRSCARVCNGVGEGGTALQPDILGTAGWRC